MKVMRLLVVLLFFKLHHYPPIPTICVIGQTSQLVTREAARKMIQLGNTAWGHARVSFVRETFDNIMAPAPEFYVQLSNGQRLDRQQFLDLISKHSPRVKLCVSVRMC